MSKRRKWTKVAPSPELLEWVEIRVTTIIQDGDRSGPGKAYWTHIVETLRYCDDLPAEWKKLSDYGQSKVLGRVLDELKDRGVLKRKKNFHPFIMTNPLDRIVEALNKSDAEEKTT